MLIVDNLDINAVADPRGGTPKRQSETRFWVFLSTFCEYFCKISAALRAATPTPLMVHPYKGKHAGKIRKNDVKTSFCVFFSTFSYILHQICATLHVTAVISQLHLALNIRKICRRTLTERSEIYFCVFLLDEFYGQ